MRHKLLNVYLLVSPLNFQFSSVQFSCSVVSNSLQTHGMQQARLPCPSPTPGAYSNSCPSSQWCHPIISSSVIPFFILPSIFPNIRVFSNESVFHNVWPKYWSFSFSISPSNEYSGQISFKIDWLHLLAVQRTLKSLLQHHNVTLNSPNFFPMCTLNQQPPTSLRKASIQETSHQLLYLLQHLSIHTWSLLPSKTMEEHSTRLSKVIGSAGAQIHTILSPLHQ